jgi:hypothetical protein
MSSSFEVLQFCQAMKESKKRSQAKDKTDKKENKKDKTDKKENKHKKPKTSQSDDEAEDDFQRVFKDNFSSSGFFNHSF